MNNLFEESLLLRQGESGTTLSETITGTAHYVKTYNWSITKDATPKSIDLFRGDTDTVTYTITATTVGYTTQAYIQGVVNICNGGAVDTIGLASTINLTQPPSQTVIASLPLDISAHPVIAANTCQEYTYQIPIPNFQPGALYKVTADTTILNHSGHLGTPFGPSASVSVVSPVVISDFINQVIHVTDTNMVNGVPFTATFTATDTPIPQSVNYNIQYTCGRYEPPFSNPTTTIYNNTATITETGQTANTSIIVNCYDLIVTKTATTSFIRTWNWSITKTAYAPGTSNQITVLTLQPGESYMAEYRIVVTPTPVDSNYAVNGVIVVTNPNPIKSATIFAVNDIITPPDSISAVITPSTPITILPGQSFAFAYYAMLPNYESRMDQSIVTLANTPSGFTDFKSQPVTFGFNLQNPTVEIDPCVNVFDSYPNPNTPLTTNPLCRIGQTFTYTRTIGPFSQCSNTAFSVDNTAMFNSISSTTSGSATSMVSVSVPCSLGCTLTIGYWKTHAGIGPRPNWPDAVSPLLPVIMGQAIVLTNTQAYAILNFQGWYASIPGPGTVADASNGINKLYAQLLAANLNIKRGASSTPVDSTLLAANNFLLTNDSSSWASLTRAQKNQVLGWATTLEQYNSGLLGVPHCSEQVETSAVQYITSIPETE